MKVYFIVPKESFLPSNEQLERIKAVAEIDTIIHTGNLSDIAVLAEDNAEKILAVDPDTFDWNLDTETLEKIPNVKAVCPSTTSFDWINPEKLQALGITGTNVPGFSSDSVAEYAIAMAIDVSRRLPLILKDGWDKGEEGSLLLRGKKMGVVGLGRIGTLIAELADGIGMEVFYYSPNSTDKRFTKASLEEIFLKSDVVIPALAENEETKKLITHELLDMMKETAIMVGINRVKDIWDEEYVLEKVKNGELRGYAFEGDNAKPLVEYEGNVLALPPIAWATEDSLETLMEIWTETIISTAKGESINVVTK